jgi:probable rRNA maturation factor
VDTVEVTTRHACLRFPHRETFRVVSRVLRVEARRRLNVSVVFVNSPYIKYINKKFLNHNFVTDVIAFPLEDGIGLDGEIYVNLDRARSQARDYGVSFSDETRRLLIHGTLHLLGYDDTTPSHRRRMRQREEFYLNILRS